MDHREPHLGKDPLYLISNAHYIVRFLQRAGISVAGGIYVLPVRCICLRAVRMHDQNLWSLFRQGNLHGR